jgi:transcriptional regulator GlxA family with amidase domain
MEADMSKRTILLSLGAVLLVALVAIPIVLAPGQAATDTPPAAALDSAEQARTIEAMRPPKRERPVIAIVARNQGTEVSDFLSAYGVLRRADVADVTVVAERAERVQLYPTLSVEPQSTMAAFDALHPDGADYVVVPAMDPGNDPFIANWLVEQYRKGAKIISICNGSRMIGTAGLLDGRRATGHWSIIPELQGKYPTMQWVQDRRYVIDNGVATSTGITANIPIMIALVEAIGGRQTAERVAGELGVTNWDARHRSSAFELTFEHKKTFVRNTLSFWRRETLGIPLAENVDEVALGLMVDAYSRTALSKVTTVAANGEAVRSRYGLVIHPDLPAETARVDEMLAAPSSLAPAMAIERELPRIASRYDLPTARVVALVMEYPWNASETGTTGQ